MDGSAGSGGRDRHGLFGRAGSAFGLTHGLLITRGRIEPFIVTLGTLGIFRAYLTYFSNGGAITLDDALSDVYSPVYYTIWPAYRSRSGCSCWWR